MNAAAGADAAAQPRGLFGVFAYSSRALRLVWTTNKPLSVALAGDIYDSAPYGYVLPLADTDFGTALAGAVTDLINDGEYKAILTKWGVEAGAITTPAVNPAS